MWAVAYLKGRKMVTEDLSKTGDNDKGMVLTEYSLVSRQEAASAIIADLT